MVVNHVDPLGPVLVREPQVLASLPGSRLDPAVETVLSGAAEAEVCSPQRHIVLASYASPRPQGRLCSACDVEKLDEPAGHFLFNIAAVVDLENFAKAENLDVVIHHKGENLAQ
jgi:hypothetical protein